MRWHDRPARHPAGALARGGCRVRKRRREEPSWQDDLESPGPFSFGKRERIVAVLRAAGLATVDVQAFDSEVVLSQTGLAAAVRFALTVGPGARLVVEATPEQRTRIEQAVALAFAPHMRDDQLLLRGAAWVVAAQVA